MELLCPLQTPDIGSEGIKLGDVVANGLSVLRLFTLQNSSPLKLLVKLSSDIGNRIKFQLENDNLSSSLLGTEEPIKEEEYNQLFSECGFIDEVELEPFSSTKLVLNFTPRSKLGLQNSILLQRELMESFLEGKGRQKFFARYSLEYFEGYLWLEVVNSFETRQADKNSQMNTSLREFYSPSYTPLMIKVSGRLCPSVLLPDVHEIVFDNCSVGETYVREVNVWNLSEISSSFTCGLKFIDRITLDGKSNYRLTGGSLGSWLYIADYESGTKIEDTVEIAGFSYRRLQVIFRALAEGEINYYLEVENGRDIRNCFTIKVSCIVTGGLPIDTLEVLNLSNGLLDFGECYYEDSYARHITIRNVSKQELEISLGSDRDEEVVYEIVNEEVQFSSVGFDNVSDGDINAYSIKALRKELVDTMSSDGSETRKSSALTTPDRVATPENPFSILDTSIRQSVDISGRIDELMIPAGQEKSIRVIFTPKRPMQEPTPTTKMFLFRETLCRLMTQTFRLFLRSKSVGSKSISCRAKVCDSIISVEPKEIDLGECDIQSLYHTSATITNLSELPALLYFRYSSKAVFIESQQVTIPPKRSYLLPIHYIPRTITSEYKKEIRIINRKNRSNDCVISLKASNIDRHRVVFHAKFYELLTDTTTNQIDFGVTVVGDPSLRYFRLRNITKSNLTLELKGNSEIAVYSILSKEALYEKAFMGIHSIENEQEERLVWRREAEIYKKKLSLVENLDEYSRKLLSHPVKEGSSDKEQRKVAWEEKIFEQKKDEKTLSDKQQELENRIKRLMELASPSQRTPTYFSDAGAELEYIETQLRAGRELARSLRDGLLIPVKQVTIGPEEEKVFFITFIPDTRKRSLKGKLRPIDSILSIRILQVDGPLPVDCIHSGITDVSQIAPREVLLLLKACKSEIELAQKHIHFGHLSVGEQRTKSIVIQNRCEAPLLYVVKKSGSVSSDDLQFDASKVGVVRPYSSKEVVFKFKPTMAGPFQETVFVENLLDSSADASITMKATVHKKSHFHVENICDTVLISRKRLQSTVGAFVLHNDSDKTREFLIEYEAKEIFSLSSEELPVIAFHPLETRDAQQLVKNLLQEQMPSLESCKTFMSKTPSSISKMKVSVKARSNEFILFWVSCQTEAQISHLFGDEYTYKFDLVIVEIKNRDVERRISATCRLSYDSDVDTTLASSDTNNGHIEQEERKGGNREDEEPLFTIGCQKLDVGGVQVGQSVRRSVRICSLCKDSTLTLELFSTDSQLDSLYERSCRVSFACDYDKDSYKCQLAAEAMTELTIEICPFAVRKFRQVFGIQGTNQKDGSTYQTSLEILYFGYSKDSIRILESRDEESLYPFCSVVDLSRRFAWIYHLHVICDVQDCNRAILNAKSNLPSQIFIYRDTKLETLAENMPIISGIAQELFLCVAPKFSEEDIVNCNAKRIVAGLQLSVCDQDTNSVLSERTWKVQGIVGIVRLECSLSGSSFWIMYKENHSDGSLECRGQLELRNVSCQFPTEFHVVCPYRDVMLSGPTRSTLGCSSSGLALMDTNTEECFISQEKLESSKYPNRATILYSFYPQETGYIVRKLYVESESFSFPAQVAFGCFVDDGTFQVKSPHLLESDHSLRIPICVRRKSFDTFASLESSSFTLLVADNANIFSNSLIILSTFTCLTGSTNNSNDALCLNGWNISFHYCSSISNDVEEGFFRYIIHHSQSLYLEKDEECFLLDHGFLERKGFLLLADERILYQPYNKESFVKKLIGCTLYYECPELVLVSENPVEVGDIGPLSGVMEKEVTFVFESKSQFIVIASLLEIPLGLVPQFSFLKEESNHTFVFHPLERKSISFLFSSERLDQSICGKSNLNLSLVNQMNEWNQLSVRIEFNYLRANLQISDSIVLMKTLRYPNVNTVESLLELYNLSPLELVLDTYFQPSAGWTLETMPVELCFMNREDGKVLESRITIEGGGHSLHLLIQAKPRITSPWILLEKTKEQHVKEESILSSIDSGSELGQLCFIPRQDELSAVFIPLYFTFELEAFVLHSPNKLILEHSSDLKKSITFVNPWTAAAFGCRLENVSLPSFLQLHSTLEEFLLKPSSQMDFIFKLKWDLSAITTTPHYSSLHLDTGYSCVFTISIPDEVFSKLSHEQQKLLLSSSWDLENLFQIIIPLEFTSSFVQELVDSFSNRQPTSSPVDSVISRASTPAYGLSEQDILFDQQFTVEEEEEAVESFPLLILRGCTSLPSNNHEVRYALDIGQVFIGQEPAPWTFILESSSPKLALCYRIFIVTMEEDDTCWISLSKQDGLLNDLDPVHEIEAYFSAFRMGYFHGYIRIENLSNPSDIIVVSVNMQVVAKLETSEQVKKEVFSVICDGRRRRRSRQNMIDYSVVFFDHVYRHRSFVITNHSSVEQEFLLKHDLYTENKSELNFSLTNNSLRKVNSLHIRPGESARVFLYYRPALELSDMANVMDTSRYDQQEITREYHVFIHCRLVKDYQEVILVRSRCRLPRLQVSPVDQIFTMHLFLSERNHSSSHGGDLFHTKLATHSSDSVMMGLSVGYPKQEERNIDSPGMMMTFSLNNELYAIDPPYCKVSIRNLSPTTPLHYRIMNNAFFFQVENSATPDIIPPTNSSPLNSFRGTESETCCSHTITIRVDSKALCEKQKILLKEKYVEEHISIYNCDLPKEFFWIRLRLSVDGTAKNFTAVMHKGTPAFETLEAIVQHLMKQVGNEFHQLHRQLSNQWNILYQMHCCATESNYPPSSSSSSSIHGEIPEEICRHMQQILEDWTVEETHRQLMFEMHYVTDELTYYALKDPSDAALLLAKLVYSFIFHQALFRWVLECREQIKETSFFVFWTGQLRHFLSFFPDKSEKLRHLYWLEEEFEG